MHEYINSEELYWTSVTKIAKFVTGTYMYYKKLYGSAMRSISTDELISLAIKSSTPIYDLETDYTVRTRCILTEIPRRISII